MKRFFKNVIIAIVIFLIIAGIFSFTVDDEGDAAEVSLSHVAEQINAGAVQKISVSENKLTVTLKDGSEAVTTKEPETSVSESLTNLGVTQQAMRGLEIEVKGPSGGAIFLSTILPFLIPFLLIGVFIYFLMRQVSGANNRAMSFGQSPGKRMFRFSICLVRNSWKCLSESARRVPAIFSAGPKNTLRASCSSMKS